MKWFRDVLDDVILLLFLGVTVFAMLYIIWGVMEIASVSPVPPEIKMHQSSNFKIFMF